ncbi:hypothetical protein NPIL_100101, partial [Nephila pilipes]
VFMIICLLSSCDAAIGCPHVSVSYCNRGGWKFTLYAPSSGDSDSSRWNAEGSTEISGANKELREYVKE